MSQETPSGRGHRAERIQQAVVEAFEMDLLPSLEDPLLADLHVVAVEITRNLASVRVTVGPGAPSANSESEVQAALDRAEGWLRSELASLLRIKRMPMLRVRYIPFPLFRGPGGGE